MTEQFRQGTELLTQLLLLGGDRQFILFEGVFELGTELLLTGALGLRLTQFRLLVGLVLGETLLPGAILTRLAHLALLDEVQQLVEVTRRGIAVLRHCNIGRQQGCTRCRDHQTCNFLDRH